jgi:CheY-like chemotaxis protein
MTHASLKPSPDPSPRPDIANADIANGGSSTSLAQDQQTAAYGRVASVVAHELTNLLQILASSLDRIGPSAKANVSPDEAVLAMQTIRASMDRGTRVARQLQTFAQLAPPRLQPRELHQLMAGWMSDFEDVVGPNMRLELRLRHSGSVLVDADQLQGTLLNLLSNAREASAPGALIVLELSRVARVAGMSVRIAVIDHGEGMSEEVVTHASAPFYTTRPPGKGMGLGLTIARMVTEAHGGSMDIDSALGRGTTVSLYLPLPGSHGRVAPASYSAGQPVPGGTAPVESGRTVENGRTIENGGRAAAAPATSPLAAPAPTAPPLTGPLAPSTGAPSAGAPSGAMPSGGGAGAPTAAGTSAGAGAAVTRPSPADTAPIPPSPLATPPVGAPSEATPVPTPSVSPRPPAPPSAAPQPPFPAPTTAPPAPSTSGLGTASTPGPLGAPASQPTAKVAAAPPTVTTQTPAQAPAQGSPSAPYLHSGMPIRPAPRSSGCVLVIDDEEAIAEYFRIILTAERYDVHVVCSAHQAIERFSEDPQRYDAVLLDMMLRDGSGIELYRSFRALRPDLRVVVCTGFSDNESLAPIRADGHDILYKPCPRSEVLKAIARAVGARRTAT